MKKITTITVDDEQLASRLMATYLADFDEIEIVAQCHNGKQAIASVNQLKPDLLFLDIQMPGLDGFDVVKGLQGDAMPLVVFVTAYDQYALKAFDVHAVDYLLKPLDKSHLKRAIERCKERLDLTKAQHSDDRANSKDAIINAIGSLSDPAGESLSDPAGESEPQNEPQLHDQKIVIRDRNAITLLEQTEIDWVDAAGDYMCIHADGTTHIMRSTLKSLLEQLNPAIFQRIHRSTIVNMQRIEKIIPLPKGEYYLLLGATDRIKVSRNYRDVIKAYLASHSNG